jgi:CheY-like chemotaxis protein
VPFLLFAEDGLPQDQREMLRTISQNIVLRDVRSPVRLLDESSLFLHRRISDLPEDKQQMLRTLYESDESLVDKRVLIIDDDLRNIFALSSVLERHRMQVITANTGRDAIQLVDQTPDLAIVLVDIMMPEMDGYETMHRIRAKTEFQRLPVIALTAKAMKGDREKCLEAGASDYIAKPVDTERLLSLLRVWLHR